LNPCVSSLSNQKNRQKDSLTAI